MLAELFLCGLASANLGLESASKFKNDFNVKDEVSVDELSSINVRSEYLNENQSKLLSYNNRSSNVSNIWENRCEETTSYNDYPTSAGTQVVFATYDNEQDLEECDGFKTTIKGNISTKIDRDFYNFYVYGAGDLKCILTDYYFENYCIQIKKLNPETGNYIDVGLTYTNATKYTIYETLSAGAYTIGVYTENNPGTTNHSYEMVLEFEYDECVEVSLGEMKYSYGVDALAWVSDYEPLNSPAFSFGKKTSQSNVNSLEKLLPMNEDILQSSIYLFGSNSKRLAKQYVQFLYDNFYNELQRLEEEKVKWETASKITRFFEDVIEIALDVVLFVATSGASEAVNEAVFIFQLTESCAELEGFDPHFLSNYFSSLVPEDQIMETEETLRYLDKLNTLFAGNNYHEDDTIRIDNYYRYTVNNGKVSINYKKDFNADEVILSEEDDIRPAFPNNSHVRGKYYPIKRLEDFHDAEKHIKHNFDLIPVTIDDCTQIYEVWDGGAAPDEIHVGEFKWFYFEAPSTGTFSIQSSTKSTNLSDNLVGELFPHTVRGRNTEDLIVSDNGDGRTGNFRLFYFLEKGETVFLRVHGENWRTVNETFSIVAQQCPVHYEVEEEDLIFKESITFANDPTIWRVFKFKTVGNKIIKAFNNNLPVKFKVCNYRGELVAESGEDFEQYSKQMLSAYFEKDEMYFIKFFYPDYKYNNKKLDFAIIATTKDYENRTDVIELSNSDNGGGTTSFEANTNEAGVGFFTPDLNAYYKFDTGSSTGDSAANVRIINSWNGEEISTTSDAINPFVSDDTTYTARLDAGQDYLIMSGFNDINSDSGKIKIRTSYYSDSYQSNSSPVIIPSTYFERTLSFYNGSYADLLVKFAEGGWKIFQTFGTGTKINIELYDSNNILLNKDDSVVNEGKGANRNVLIYNEVNEGETYRIRIRSLDAASSTLKRMKLTIVPTENYYSEGNYNSALNNFDTFDKAYLTSAWNSNGTGYRGVFSFTAPYDGCYSFSSSTNPGYPEPSEMYIVDTTSVESINENTDHYESFGYSGTGLRAKNMVKGRQYFIFINATDDWHSVMLGYIYYEGIKLGSFNTFNISNSTTSNNDARHNGVYVPTTSGYYVFDTSLTYTSCNTSFSVCDLDTNNEVSYTDTEVRNGKSLKVAYLEKDHPYVLDINATGYSGNSCQVYMAIRNNQGPGLDKAPERITIGSDSRYHNEVRYDERVVHLQAGKTMTYYYTFALSGTKLFQTFGSKDTLMYLYDGNNLLTSDDDKGYGSNALIRYNVQANKEYKLVVKFWNSSEVGDIKTTVTPISSGYSWWNTFEDLSTSSYPGNSSFMVYHYTNCSYPEVISVDKGGTYEIETNTNFDTFLYLVDATSTTSCVYDDDGGSGHNAKIRKYLYSGRKYYLVICAFDLSLSDKDVDINISRV